MKKIDLSVLRSDLFVNLESKGFISSAANRISLRIVQIFSESCTGEAEAELVITDLLDISQVMRETASGYAHVKETE